MFEQDYIMRLIREMVRAILKLLFQIDTDHPTVDLLEDEEQQSILNGLMAMIDAGNVNEAENRVYEMTSGGNTAYFEIALLFYYYLNEKDDDFLQEHDYCREEIQLGIKNLASEYGVSGVIEAYSEVSC